jgi:hypothetical protein
MEGATASGPLLSKIIDSHPDTKNALRPITLLRTGIPAASDILLSSALHSVIFYSTQRMLSGCQQVGVDGSQMKI